MALVSIILYNTKMKLCKIRENRFEPEKGILILISSHYLLFSKKKVQVYSIL